MNLGGKVCVDLGSSVCFCWHIDANDLCGVVVVSVHGDVLYMSLKVGGCCLWGGLSIGVVVVVDCYCDPCLSMLTLCFGVCGGEKGVIPQGGQQVSSLLLFGCELGLCEDHYLGLVEVTDLLYGVLVGEYSSGVEGKYTCGSWCWWLVDALI